MTTQLLQTIAPNQIYLDNKSETSTDGEELDYSQVHLASSRKVQRAQNNSSKVKSSLCKNYTQKGYCPYGARCQFAHGPEELRINLDHNRSYKTKDCYTFRKQGFCCFGDRCNFIHQKNPEQSQQKQKWTVIYSNHRQILRNNQNPNSRLLRLLALE